ncbi:MAG TPA: glucose 1-dehydrogenase [Chthoniobacterales bacterium]|jgi:3-oxoacyl-[acyl-carrier protein] reductase|nr:glucose 1-dehydrogenase [Chthoniobacterales bacterium]
MNETNKLTGQVAVVTGASKGIGAEIAQALAAAGASVVVNYSSARAGADRVVDQIAKRGGKAIAVQANVSQRAEVAQLFAAATKAFGQINILVNNAGVYAFAPLEEITEEQFHRHFDINVLGLLLVTQEAVKHFHPAGGSVINISSAVTSLTPPNTSVYTATKGAVDAITRTLAKELAPRKIRVNGILPGMIETEGVKSAGMNEGEFRREVEVQTPLGRIGQPNDIAPAAVFLASPDAAYITGETLRIAGGLR